MFQVAKELNVSAGEFMYVLRNSVSEEAKGHGFENMDISQVVEGFVYFKKLKTAVGSEAKVKTYINCYIPETQYSATITSVAGEYAVTYAVEKTQNGIIVEYTEADSYKKTLKKWNAGLMKFIFGRKQRKEILKMLSAMEAYIISDRSKLEAKVASMAKRDALDFANHMSEEE